MVCWCIFNSNLNTICTIYILLENPPCNYQIFQSDTRTALYSNRKILFSLLFLSFFFHQYKANNKSPMLADKQSHINAAVCVPSKASRCPRDDLPSPLAILSLLLNFPEGSAAFIRRGKFSFALLGDLRSLLRPPANEVSYLI